MCRNLPSPPPLVPGCGGAAPTLPSPYSGTANLSTIAQLAGYRAANIQWRGKWHLLGGEYPFPSSEAASSEPTPIQDTTFDDDLAAVGFRNWDSPDGGISTRPLYMGGGTPIYDPAHPQKGTNGNDARYLRCSCVP